MFNDSHRGLTWAAIIAAIGLVNLAAPWAWGGEIAILTESQQLMASDGAPSDIFGFRLAVDGDTAIVGALGHDTAPGPIGGQGAAYVFVRTSKGWIQQARLTASDGQPLDQFGVSVAIDGNTAVVGAYMPAGARTGAAYVFQRSGAPGSETWTQTQKLTAADGAGFDYFGISAAIEGDTIVAGATRADTPAGADAGAAYVFKRNGSHWNQSAKLTASNGAVSDLFGNSVDISGDTIAVGAYLKNTPFQNTGSAYVFVRSGGQWIQQAYLPMPEPTTRDEFGRSVTIQGNTLLIGAPFHPFNVENGAVYVFIRDGAPGSETWSQHAKLTASDGSAHDQFGTDVEFNNETAVVGARWHNAGAGAKSGAAYLLARAGDLWNTQAKLTASDGAAGDEFGDSVALHDGTVLVGAIFDDTPAGADAGSVYAFAVEPTPVTGDITGDGNVNIDDLLAVINAWGACPQPCPPNCPADVDDNCTVNIDDLVMVISNWG